MQLMTDWTSGYIVDIAYTYGYYTELNPLRIKLAFLNAGLLPPKQGYHCELGYGQGVCVNMHAAGSDSIWYANDFNPDQASFAQELAKVSGANAQLTDESFVDFCSRTDLPDFDSIGLHGVWSWISDDNRAVIVDFLRRKLKVGGVLYISYNTQPGWAAMLPFRDLLTEHSEVMGSPGYGMIPRIDGALDFVGKLFATTPHYTKVNPQVVERFNQIKDQDRSYLAHEYFNRDWLPMSFTRLVQWLSPAKLNYACSAHYLDHIDSINLSSEQQALLNDIPDSLFRETVRDFCVNKQFRKDYWVKGVRQLSSIEQTEALRAQKILLVTPRIDVSLKTTSTMGEVTLHDSIYDPILDLLADHKIKTIGQIEQLLIPSGLLFDQLNEAIMVMAGLGYLISAQDESVVANAKKQTDKLNTYLLDKARSRNDINFLASPVSGGGFAIGHIQQLFLLALSLGKKQPADWVQMTLEALIANNEKIVKDGEVLETPEQNLAELTELALYFAEKQLPILRALQIA